MANDFSASFGGVQLLTKVNNASFNYTTFSYTVMATSDSTTVSFAGREVPGLYELDNVSVTDDPPCRSPPPGP